MTSTQQLLLDARGAMAALAQADGSTRSDALRAMARRLRSGCGAILRANAQDLEAAKATVAPVMLDRLRLDEARVESMAAGLEQVAVLDDPLGRTLSETRRPNGLIIRQVSVPMGLIAIIYESRPNVTADAAALAVKSGSACVLRGGKEAFCSNNAIVNALKQGLEDVGLPGELVALVQDTSRASAAELMRAVGLVDLLIPRGGAGLIRACVENAAVPVIQTGTGICHIYVDRAADPDMALDIVENAKTSRPSVCNAAEVCLVHKDAAPAFLPRLRERLVTRRTERGLVPVQLRLDAAAAALIPGTPAGAGDFDTEFLDYILAVAVVDSLDAAVEHIARHSTGHSEAIVTADEAAAEAFTRRVDSAAVYVNASTRFTDGGEFGLGCEMGISTQKLHARGPMGLAQLTGYKYIILGSGQIR